MAKKKKGSAVSETIRETLHKFKRTGKIGTSHPGSMRQATKQAAAIAFRKAGGGKRRGKRKK